MRRLLEKEKQELTVASTNSQLVESLELLVGNTYRRLRKGAPYASYEPPPPLAYEYSSRLCYSRPRLPGGIIDIFRYFRLLCFLRAIRAPVYQLLRSREGISGAVEY
jgi:hypothetical protein